MDESEGVEGLVEVEESEEGEWNAIPEYIIIRENIGYDDQDLLEEQLEDALEDQVDNIVIEPKRIGDETTKWIRMGNTLHKTTVLAGLGCISTGLTLPKYFKNYIYIPLGVVSLSSVILYGTSWQYDPCCKYQVESDPRALEKLHIDNLTSSSVVVLTRKDDKYRKRLHNIVAVLVLSYFGWNLYKWYTKP